MPNEQSNTSARQCGPAQPPLAFWFCTISCSLELSFRVVQSPGVGWKSLPKVFPGCSVVGTKSLFLEQTSSCGCPRNPPKVQQSGWRGAVSKCPKSPSGPSSMGHWHGHYSLSSQCMPKERSEPHIHTHQWNLQTKNILMWLRLKSSDCLQPDSPFFLRFSNYTQYFQRGFIKRRDWCLLKTYLGILESPYHY